jgi:hypothetical protein
MMRVTITRAVVAAITIASLVVGATPAAAASGDIRWMRRYNSGPTEQDVTRGITVTPDGSKVVVTGYSATIAYDAATGTKAWTEAVFGSAIGANDESVFVSPCVCALTARDPLTGDEQWSKVYGEPSETADTANRLSVSDDGNLVVVTGFHSTSTPSGDDQSFRTRAFDAATGDELWVSGYDGPLERGYDIAFDVAISDDGSLVVVSGAATGLTENVVTTAIAYDGASGEVLWTRRLGIGWGTGVAIAPDGTAVFVTGSLGFKTFALDADDGATLWSKGYAGMTNKLDLGSDVALTPDGATLVVTGDTDEKAMTTIAYNAVTGARHWLTRHSSPGGWSHADELVTVAGGARVVIAATEGVLVGGDVNGSSFDLATVAYRVGSGRRAWINRYDGPAHDQDGAVGVVAAPGGGSAYVAAVSRGSTTTDDYLTFAFAA